MEKIQKKAINRSDATERYYQKLKNGRANEQPWLERQKNVQTGVSKPLTCPVHSVRPPQKQQSSPRQVRIGTFLILFQIHRLATPIGKRQAPSLLKRFGAPLIKLFRLSGDQYQR